MSEEDREDRCYFCIDMKCFYASVECAERKLNPFETCLVVADETRGKNALCLAISPKMKSLGVKNRCRLSDIPPTIDYLIAPPQMHLYIEYAADIYGIYLEYFDKNDIYVYSIDESFIDVTEYLKLYQMNERQLAKKMMNLIADRLHIPSTAGIGTNLYLAKIALDITAKHARDHMGYLNQKLYRQTLWDYRPITDFWQIADGKANRLARRGIVTMGGIAHAPQELLYKIFGVDAELLIDHAWGRESCRIEDIKNYRSKSKSVSFSQILPRNYSADEAAVVMSEMISNGAQELMRRGLITEKIGIEIGYSFGGRAPSIGNVRMTAATAAYSVIMRYAMGLYEQIADPNAAIRRLSLFFPDVCDEGCEGYDLFTDVEAIEKEKTVEKAVIAIKNKYGKNAILRGTSYYSCATQRERNGMIGGHKA